MIIRALATGGKIKTQLLYLSYSGETYFPAFFTRKYLYFSGIFELNGSLDRGSASNWSHRCLCDQNRRQIEKPFRRIRRQKPYKP